MSNKGSKRSEIRRIIIFCVLAYLPVWIITPLMNMHYGELMFASGNTAVGIYLFGVFGMFAPAAANLATRLITREGMENSFLALNFKGNGRYYLMSVLAVMAELLCGAVLFYAVYLNGMSFAEAFPPAALGEKTASFLFRISYSIVIFFTAFGEEWGWRGYLMPKLTRLMGKPAAVIVGGVIWGIWHAPLTVSGHNFGVDYPFYPWLGILLMCLLCAADNAFLTLLTERTGSVYPASFFHMLNNNCSLMVLLNIFGGEETLAIAESVPPVRAFLTVLFVPTAILGAVSFVLLSRKSRGQTP